VLNIDVTGLEPVDQLDAEEMAIHHDFRDGKLVLRSDKATKANYANIFKIANCKRKALSLRMPENDYLEIKSRVLALGLPYSSTY
jgi:predicted DNA binding CopG/RHH family protein